MEVIDIALLITPHLQCYNFIETVAACRHALNSDSSAAAAASSWAVPAKLQIFETRQTDR